MDDLLARVREYIKFERNDDYRELVKKLVADNNDAELKRLFGHRLTFGTAGIRGCMGPGYGQMNDLVIIQTSQGLVSYLIETHGHQKCKERGVIIGHDARHNSDRFARLAALAFLNKSIPVFYCEHIIPTPLVAYGVNLFNCLCGVMVTASHNPKQDNGYKVYWSNGAQILSPHDKNIQRHIEEPENQEPWTGAWRHECLATSSSLYQPPSSPTDRSLSASKLGGGAGIPKEFEPLFKPIHGPLSKSYFGYIQRIVGDQRIQNQSASISITYTAMHGVGHTFLTRALDLAGFDEIFPVEAQKKPDPEFSTVKFPNPEEAGALDCAFQTASHANSTLILANDPDADRCAAALYDPNTQAKRVLTGNEIGALLGWWSWFCYKRTLDSGPPAASSSPFLFNEEPQDLIKQQSSGSTSGGFHSFGQKPLKEPKDCYMLSTAVSSRFLHSMARVEGFKFIETLTGFKYMGNTAHDLIHNRDKLVLFAYEEAIGYMVNSEILDKDGISAAVQVAQCAAHLKNVENRTLESHLDWLYQHYGYHYSINSYFICNEPRTIRAIFHDIQSDYPKSFTSAEQPSKEFKVTRIRDLNNGFDNGSPNNKASLPVSGGSFMVTFFVGEEIQFTIRTSGTEPKIKYYSEIVSKLPDASSVTSEAMQLAKAGIQAKLKCFLDAAIERCLKPSYYDLDAAA
uniref:Phosphoglucomutase-2 n=2 Tax=Aceria tosichella TaxID=561515 RepID=A0A6G1SNY6_9ACAR